MGSRTQIKVHNVFHDKDEYDPSQVEDAIESWITRVECEVRIAPGPQNSPIFIVVDTNSLSLEQAKTIAHLAVNRFSDFVDGVNVESTISESNIRVKSVE